MRIQVRLTVKARLVLPGDLLDGRVVARVKHVDGTLEGAIGTDTFIEVTFLDRSQAAHYAFDATVTVMRWGRLA